MKHPILLLLAIFMMASCQYQQSISKNLITGLTSKGNGLSCENIYLTDGVNTLKKSEFIYGEKFYLTFYGVEGFERAENFAMPGMEITVKDRKGEIVIHEADAYHNLNDGTDVDPLDLTANMLIASPLHSNQAYTYHVRIWDKQGNGELTANLRFKVIPNEALKIEAENVEFKEVYLYSDEKKRVLVNNEIGPNETIIIALEGLEGFSSQEGKSALGVRINAVDNTGTTIVNEADLLAGALMDTSDVREAINTSLVISDSTLVNPVHCTVEVWDKNGPNRITVNTELTLL